MRQRQKVVIFGHSIAVAVLDYDEDEEGDEDEYYDDTSSGKG